MLKRQREAAKRARERRKAEKAALKRERRHGRKPGTQMASRDDLIGLGLIEPEPTVDLSESKSETTDEASGSTETPP